MKDQPMASHYIGINIELTSSNHLKKKKKSNSPLSFHTQVKQNKTKTQGFLSSWSFRPSVSKIPPPRGTCGLTMMGFVWAQQGSVPLKRTGSTPVFHSFPQRWESFLSVFFFFRPTTSLSDKTVLRCRASLCISTWGQTSRVCVCVCICERD